MIVSWLCVYMHHETVVPEKNVFYFWKCTVINAAKITHLETSINLLHPFIKPWIPDQETKSKVLIKQSGITCKRDELFRIYIYWQTARRWLSYWGGQFANLVVSVCVTSNYHNLKNIVMHPSDPLVAWYYLPHWYPEYYTYRIYSSVILCVMYYQLTVQE